jgi:hypothetical protein
MAHATEIIIRRQDDDASVTPLTPVTDKQRYTIQIRFMELTWKHHGHNSNLMIMGITVLSRLSLLSRQSLSVVIFCVEVK